MLPPAALDALVPATISGSGILPRLAAVAAKRADSTS
jgi:hypothetical protein